MEAADTTTELQAADLTRLSLSHAPFSTGPGEVRFADAAHKTQVNIALHMLQDSERVLAVTGEAGVGKSTFLLALTAREAADLAVVPLSGRELTSTSAICEQFLLGLGVPLDGRINAADFLKHLWEIHDRGSRPTLLLDDAHRLPAPVLQSLLQLWDKAAADLVPFGLVLAVGNAFDTGRVEDQLTDPEQLHVINLHPFTEQQTGEYVRHHLQASGNDGALFSGPEIRQIYLRSRGVPQAINIQGQQLLKAKSKAIARTALLRRVLLWTGAVGLTGIAFLIAVLMRGDGFPGHTQDTAFDLPLPAPVADSTEPEPTTRPNWGFSPLRTPSLPEASAIDAPPADEMVGDAEPERTLDTVALSIDEAPAVTEADATSSPDEIDASPTEPDLPEAEEEPRFQGIALAESRRWLEGRVAEHLTLQLIAAHEADTIVRFIELGAMPPDAHVVRTLREGRDWFVVLVGDHSGREEALAALAALPEETRAEGAWVRSFDSLQSALP